MKGCAFLLQTTIQQTMVHETSTAMQKYCFFDTDGMINGVNYPF